ncbi:YadA-like family protein [Burkholderia sp. Ac-20379]|uniref:YadA-like family protein n=1 Tax=Burkholderia sp. Ac-20379 TaxID=2703900 RepID=UPI00197FE10C|nr:ESPR-type extended signal peptide-containing protein [Burkholderia sp. Ac-20379]MBN3723457.1 hypothetical protein [Burkholderia sp. Ac-20379]
MNKTYRVVWNASTGAWCAVSETARTRGKSTSVKKRVAVAAALVAASMGSAFAVPNDTVDGPLPETESARDARETARDAGETARDAEADDTAVDPRGLPSTRTVATDNSKYVKIDVDPSGNDVASASGSKSIAMGSRALAQGEQSVAIGSDARTSSAGSGLGGALAIGSGTRAAGNGVALGSAANAQGDIGAVAVGASATAGGKSALAIGNGAKASGIRSYALGSAAIASKNGALAIGSTSRADGINATAIGNMSVASGEDSMAFGSEASATEDFSIAIGSLSVADREMSVSVGAEGVERQIINVARGTHATDVVNVEQLQDAVQVFGGGADVDADGNITSPTYTIGGKKYSNVGDALVAAAESGGGGDGVQYDSASKDTVTLGGTGAQPVALKNVKAGALTAKSTDAVNGSQLFATNKNIDDLKDSLEDGGLIDPTTGESMAVTYDDVKKGKVTLKGGKTGTTLSNVKAGVADMDAVNVSQLKSSGLIDDDGTALSAVTYDDEEKGKVTLGGGAAGTTLTNVKAGALTAKSTDAVNGSQLFATNKNIGDLKDSLEDGGLIDPTTGESMAVTYDDVKKGKVTLKGGKTGTTLGNVKAGTADMDAVNVSQLKSSGLIGDDGTARSAVTYDDAGKGKVTLGGGAAGTTLTNVKAGALTDKSTDAVNGSQLFATNKNVGDLKDSLEDGGVIDPTTGESLAVTYNDTKKDKVTLKGGATGTTLSNVKAGTADMDAVNVLQLKSSGLIGDDGTARSAVTYDDDEKGKVTLGGGAAGTTLTNVKTGALTAKSTDAVNGSQLFATNKNIGDLKDSLEDGGVIDPTTGESLAVTYDEVNKGKVTLKGGKTGTTLGNVKAGTADMDAVNVSQLKSSGLIGDDGTARAAVTYDDAGKGKVTLGGAAGTTLTNVKAGALTDKSTDAVNGSQLFATNKNVGDLKDSLEDGGVIDPTTGESLAVTYNDTKKDTVTLKGGAAGTTLSNVKAGTADMDAVNVSQLKSSGLIGDDGAARAAVTYDDDGKGKVTLGGGAAGTTLTNVKAGALTAKSTDAVNGSQLFATNKNVGDLKDSLEDSGLIDPTTGESLAVTYNDTKKDTVTLKGGAAGTTLGNVKAGTADMDAVNVSQLKSSGLIGDDGKAMSAVTYDDAGKGKVTLGGAAGTTLTNVKAGALTDKSTDAVNGSQLFATNKNVGDLKDSLEDGGVIDPTTGESLAVTYNDTKKDTVTLKGSATGTTLKNVKAGIEDKDAVNVAQLKDSGLIGDDGKSHAAVLYDQDKSGNANYASVTLGKAAVPVGLHNVAAGIAQTDAVNVSQLTGVTDALGGEAAVGSDGKIKAPAYKVHGKTYDNVGDALKAAAESGNGADEDAVHYDAGSGDGTVTLSGKGGTTLKNVKAGTADMDAVNVSQLKSSGLIGDDGTAMSAVTYDDAGKGKVTLGGGAAGTTLTNVKAGALTAKSTDAVNGSQLFATNKNIGDLKDSLEDGGVIDPTTGKSMAVTYDDVNKGKVTLKGGKTGTTLGNVKAGTADMDAVNVSQLKSSGLIGDDGKAMSAVTYDDAGKGKVTLGGGAAGTTLTNVKAGALTAKSTDAVIGSQLFATNKDIGDLKDSLEDGGVIDPTTGESLAVTYNDVTKDTVTLKGGAAGTTLSNVKAGTADMDAVNVSQLKDSGLIDGDGTARSALTYDDESKNKVTLGGGAAGTTLTNVKAGALTEKSTDAVNGGQLFQTNKSIGDLKDSLEDGGVIDPTTGGSLAVTYNDTKKDKVSLQGKAGTLLTNLKAGAINASSTDAVNGSQLFDLASSVADSLGGNAEVDADGMVTAPTYVVDGKTYHNVGDAIAAAADTGGGGGGENAVQYDDESKSAVTLGTKQAGKPVSLKNVAAGVADTDAVNVKQLTDATGEIKDGLADGTLEMKYIKVKADGAKAVVTGEDSVAIGSLANALADNSVSIGSGSRVGPDATNSVAIGYGSVATKANTFAVGSTGNERRIVNVAAGKDDTDAVNMKQLHDVLAKVDGLSTVDRKSRSLPPKLRDVESPPDVIFAFEGKTSDMPNLASVKKGSKSAAIAVGFANVAAGEGAVSFGYKSAAYGDVSVALGTGASTLAKKRAAVAIGYEVFTGANYAVAIGSYDVIANGDYSTALGSDDVHAVGDGSVAIGRQAQARSKAVNSIAIGTRSAVEVDVVGGMALGANSIVKEGNYDGIALGTGSVANRGNALSIGSSTSQRQIVNVAAGTAETDAVNVSQMKDSGLIDDGGKARVAVTYDGPDKDQVTFAGADGTTLKNVNAGVDDKDAVNVSQMKDAGLIGGDGKSLAAVTYDGSNKDRVTFAGIDGTTLKNVNAGVDDKDAVNVSQLKSSGLIGDDGKSRAAVLYDQDKNGKPNYASVTLGNAGTPVGLHNVAAGSTDTDAVNVKQLKDSGLIDDDGAARSAVTYDDESKNKVTLAGGAGGTTLTNVKAGALTEKSTDAVNGGQLFQTNKSIGDLKDSLEDDGVIDPTTGESLAVTYDDTKKDKVTLKAGKTGTTLSNVKAGTADMDAVNVSQLKDSGLIDEDGSARSAVTYDDESKNKVTLGGGAAGTTLTNVKAGALTEKSTDAVNGGQLFQTNKSIGDLKDSLEDGGLIDPTTGESLAVTYNDAKKDKVALKGGKTGTTLSNVKAGTADMDAVNVSQLKDSGLIDDDGSARSAVTYDDESKSKVTLDGSAGGTTLTNVKAGALTEKSTDAVNGGQLFQTNKSIGDLKDSLEDGGLIDPTTGESMAVTYDDTKKGKVTLKGGKTGTTLGNVKAGTADMDAVNVSQLKDSGLIDDDGSARSAVTYDDESKNKVTLGGGAGTTLTNVKAGALTEKSTDAVNGGQLFATNKSIGDLKDSLEDGGLIDPTTGESMAVTYDDVKKGKVTLKGKIGTTLSNVRAGTADMDAVNVSQLKDSGLIDDDGTARSAVTYDDESKSKVTLDGGVAGTTLTNVKAGALTEKSTDAVNGGQLFATNKSIGDLKDSLEDGGLIDPTTGESLAVTYNDAKKDKVTLKGGKTGTTLGNVKAGTADMDAVNVSQLKDSGLIDDDGTARSAVTYDDESKNKVTLDGGAGGTTLTNVKAGALTEKSTDAVNGGQLFATNKNIGDLKDSLEDGGLIDPTTGESMAVTYDDTKKGKVTLKGGKTGTTLSNVKAGTADMDAVNVKQLKDSGLIDGGGTARSAVTYDDKSKNKVTLDGGAGGTTLTNVKAGALTEKSTDAVNGGQLFQTNKNIGDLKDSLEDGGVIDPTTGESLAVTYNDTKKDKVTLKGGKTGTTLSNVKAGTANMDAVNVKQLKDSGLIGDDGNSRAAVLYDQDQGGMTNYASVTLGNAGVPVGLHNIAAGSTDTDAVNVSQLKGVTDALGGDAGVGADGKIKAPSYEIGDQTYNNVGDALKAAAETGNGKDEGAVHYDAGSNNGTVTLAGKDGTTLKNVNAGVDDKDAVNVTQLKNAGLIGDDGKSRAAVLYDQGRDGKPNYASVTLGNAGAPVGLHNIAAGRTDTDAVNVSQLTGVTDALGGDAGVGADGKIKAPSYKIGDDTYDNVGDALAATAKLASGTDPNGVIYDSSKQDTVTLTGKDGTTLKNVNAGVDDKDAVNVSQLKDAGLIGGDGKSRAAVTYDGPNQDRVTLAGKDGTKLSNVKAGTADMDAVNVSQLKDSGLIDDKGSARSAVTYDDESKNKVTLGGGATGTTLTNVKAGALTEKSTDAVNGGQLFQTNKSIGDLKDSLEDGGLIDPTTGESLAVTYDGTKKDKVTLKGGKTGTTLSNVKAGTADMDAVNVKQLKDSGLIDDKGSARSAVTYDDESKNKVTLGGGAAGTTLTNVKAGALTEKSTDAVNGGQLFQTNKSIGDLKDSLEDGGVIDPTTGESLAVTYDGTKKDKVTLKGGKTGTTLSNVKAGTADMDAVNVSQLKDTGLIGDDGKSRAAVLYDQGRDGKPNYASVTLGNAGAPVGLHNIAAGSTDTDAVNVSQLKGVTDALGGDAGVGADGKIKAPSYEIGDKTYDNVGDALKAAAETGNGPDEGAVHYDVGSNNGTVTLAGKNGTTLKNVNAGVDDKDAVNVSQLKDAGLIGDDGKSRAAVTYDGPSQDQVTLAGTGGTKLSNVKAGTADMDAVNVSQLKDTGLIGDGGKSRAAVLYDQDQGGKPNYASVTLGNAGAPVGLHNIAAGRTDTDAVNVSQLTGVTDALGGDAGVGADGKIKAPSYEIGDKTYDNVGDALKAAAETGNGPDENAVHYDTGSNNGTVTLAGKNGTTLKNVNAGVDDKDAVNVSQLKDAGLIGDDGKSRAAVTYDGPNQDQVTLAGKDGTKLSKVKAGTADMDAVNVAQLKDTGLIGDDGKSRAAVTYDGPSQDQVTLAGTGGTKLSNVKAGTADMDAVNVAQLKDTGLIGDDGKSLAAVTYDGPNQDQVTLAGTGGTKLSNVKAGTADMDAVNVAQLKDTGLIGDDGKSRAAVLYDQGQDGKTNYASVTLGNAGAPVGLHNVAAGRTDTDAVNVSQLTGVTDALGGDAGVGADGKIKAPSYEIGDKTYDNVGDALKAAAETGNGPDEGAVHYDVGSNNGTVTLAGKDGTTLKNVNAGVDDKDAVNVAQLKDAGLIGDDGKSRAAVTYDGPNQDQVTLAGKDGTTLKNVNAGVDDKDAVNVSQLKSSGLIGDDGKPLAAVTYDADSNKSKVTLAGANGTTLSNVADGVADKDAVNVSQMKSAGLIGDGGKTLAAVTYDQGADGNPDYSSVTLGKADTAVGLHNVAAGTAATDAVNVSQLTGVTDALGGGTTIDPTTGAIVAPTYDIGGNTYHNVGDALTDIDGRVKDIQSNIGDATDLAGAVAYDRNADKSVNFDSVTLGNGRSTGPVHLTNVADGTSTYDAVNYGQLSALSERVDDLDDRLGAVTIPGDPGNPGGGAGNDLISGTGGHAAEEGEVVAANSGNGNGNTAAGSSSRVSDGVNDGTAIGTEAQVKANGGTAIGEGAKVGSSAENSVALGNGSVASEANTVSVGAADSERRIVHVADGVNSTDAVNKGQLDRAIGGVRGQINDLSKNAYSGIAAATALTMIPGVDPGKNLSFGVAGASYKGYQAVALGGEARITENLKIRAGVGLASGGNTFGVGASYQW